MGTSRASSGSPSKVPMVPPWVPDIPPDEPTDVEPNDPGQPDTEGEPDAPPAPNKDGEPPGPNPAANGSPAPVPIAPAARFSSARRTLGSFASSGGKGKMRRGVGQYVRTGLGGSGTAARRFGGTARTANALYHVLGGGLPGRETPGPLDTDLLKGKSLSLIHI